ncbi:unnamed protein product [Didymodactylos carnosus]|uniref:Uncharacterized protein n=1 Tax=Didymodactylos carnosus TaxID=1234261 RepID=A0A8S2F759_9BILA|nr:unnamed protein product [Didymodactylos carnosus]CAF4181124.1 unnamed protein product [Didymodactylos carnosus]
MERDFLALKANQLQMKVDMLKDFSDPSKTSEQIFDKLVNYIEITSPENNLELLLCQFEYLKSLCQHQHRSLAGKNLRPLLKIMFRILSKNSIDEILLNIVNACLVQLVVLDIVDFKLLIETLFEYSKSNNNNDDDDNNQLQQWAKHISDIVWKTNKVGCLKVLHAIILDKRNDKYNRNLSYECLKELARSKENMDDRAKEILLELLCDIQLKLDCSFD